MSKPGRARNPRSQSEPGWESPRAREPKSKRSIRSSSRRAASTSLSRALSERFGMDQAYQTGDAGNGALLFPDSAPSGAWPEQAEDEPGRQGVEHGVDDSPQ